jgi:hypothetical protein
MVDLILIEILAVPAEQSRGRRNPRVVKRKMSNFPTKARAAPTAHQVLRYEEHIRVLAPVIAKHRDRRLGPTKQVGYDHVRAWRASGLSRRAYCQAHRLQPSVFNTWVARSRSVFRRP